MLLEMESFDALAAANDRLQAAGLTALAFHEPKRLREEGARLRAEARALSSADASGSALRDRTALVAYARSLDARVRAGQVLERGA